MGLAASCPGELRGLQVPSALAALGKAEKQPVPPGCGLDPPEEETRLAMGLAIGKSSVECATGE